MTIRIGKREKRKIIRRLGSGDFLNSQRNPYEEKIYHDQKMTPLGGIHQKNYAPSKIHYFGKTGIATYISHVNGGYQKTIIRTKTNSGQSYLKQNQIFSLVIRVRNGNLAYVVNERSEDDMGEKANGTEFQKLYNHPWIAGSRHAQNELHAIEKTIAIEKDSIEKYLGAELI